MIKVNISLKDNLINSISIKGHAHYEVSGKDIVCSAVSSIVITTVNAIIRYNQSSIDYVDQDGYIKLDVLKHDDMIDLLINNMVDLLKELEEQYKKYIEIN